jgi:GT2 family glycosyltransferase
VLKKIQALFSIWTIVPKEWKIVSKLTTLSNFSRLMQALDLEDISNIIINFKYYLLENFNLPILLQIKIILSGHHSNKFAWWYVIIQMVRKKWKRPNVYVVHEGPSTSKKISNFFVKWDPNKKIDLVLQIPLGIKYTPLLYNQIAKIWNQNAGSFVIYWDEILINRPFKNPIPHFKPAFNKDYLISWNYIGDCFAYTPSANDQLDRLKHPLEFATGTYQFIHLPLMLTITDELESKLDLKVEKKAREQYFQNQEVKIKMKENTFNIDYPIKVQEEVAILISFKNKLELLENCIRSLIRYTSYPRVRVYLLNNKSDDPKTINWLKSTDAGAKLSTKNLSFEILDFDMEFNYAKIHNLAIQKITAPYILLLNNDTEIIAEGWLRELLKYAQLERVGAVGAKLIYANNTIQHGGVRIGMHGAADHFMRYVDRYSSGYFNRGICVQQLSACTAACLMFKREKYLEVGGMDEKAFPIAFNDVDLCLKFRAKGWDIIYNPHVELFHFESLSRKQDYNLLAEFNSLFEVLNFKTKWKKEIDQGDPFIPALIEKIPSRW